MRTDAEEAAALLAEANRLDGEGRHEEEIAAYDDAIRRFADSADPDVVEHVLCARLCKAITLYDLDREQEALDLLEDLARRAAPDGDLAGDRLAWVFSRATKYQAYALQALDRDAEALARYDEVEARFGHATDPAVLIDVVQGLRDKADLLWYLERREEALEALARLIRRLGATDDEDLAEEVALGGVTRGVWLTELDRHQEALEAYESALRCAPLLGPDHLVRLQYGRGCALRELGRDEEAIEQFAEIAGSSTANPTEVVRRHAAWAGNWEGILLRRAGRPVEAIAAHRAVVAMPDDGMPDVRAERAGALLHIASCLARNDRLDEAIHAYDELLVGFSDDEDLAADVEQVLHAKVTLLAHLNRPGETIVLADSLAERRTHDGLSAVQLEQAMSAKGVALAAEGRFEEAIEAFDTAIDAIDEADDPGVRCAIGLALCNKSAALAALGREDEALAIQEEVADRFGGGPLQRRHDRRARRTAGGARACRSRVGSAGPRPRAHAPGADARHVRAPRRRDPHARSGGRGGRGRGERPAARRGACRGAAHARRAARRRLRAAGAGPSP